MLATGQEKLERMRDRRVVYIGSERVDDVTRHPTPHNKTADLPIGGGSAIIGFVTAGHPYE